MNIKISDLHRDHPAAIFARELRAIFVTKHDLVDAALDRAMGYSRRLTPQQAEAVIAGYIVGKFGPLDIEEICPAKNGSTEIIERFLTRNRYAVVALAVVGPYRKYSTARPACQEVLDKIESLPNCFVCPEKVVCIWLGVNSAMQEDK